MTKLTDAQQYYMKRLRELRRMVIGRGPNDIHHATAEALEHKGLVTIKSKRNGWLTWRVAELVDE